jgi:antitoxin HicB
MSDKKETPPQEVLDICKRPYARVLIPDEEAKEGEYAWAAFVLELPGCLSDGRTPEEAARNLENAMESWVWATVEKGQHIPEPRLNTDHSGKFVVRTSRSLHSQIAAYAAIEGVSMNQFITTALANEVGRSESNTSSCNRCKKKVPKGELLPGRILSTQGMSGFAEALCQTCFDKRQENLKEGREDD